MSDLNPNPENQNLQGEAGDPEGLDAAAEAFDKKAPINPEEEAEPEHEPDADSTEEADEAEPAEEEADETAVEVEFEGKTYEVAPELREALLRQSDYSRKMNEVKAKEQVYTERIAQIESLTEGAQKYAEALAGAKVIEAELEQLRGIDIEALEQSDPTKAATVAVRQLRLQRQYDAALADAKSIGQKVKQERGELFSQARADMEKALQKDLKGWGEELGSKLTAYATKTGVQLKTLQTLTDPAMVVLMDKARRFDDLQASKTAIKAKAKDAPKVVKPGSLRKPDAKGDAMARLRKDNSIDAATAAFMARD